VLLFGLLGPNGALPIHLTEYIRDRLRNDDDPTLARFLDLFHHRMLSLFYRAWANSQPTVQADRPQDDRFRLYVGSLFGLGLSSLQDRDRVPDSAKLYYAGALGCQNRHAGGLRALLAEFFGMPVALEEFVGQWIVLPERDRLYLGASSATGLLGVNSTVGERIYDCQQKFRVRFGPMGYEDYLRMLPGSDSLKRLVDLVRSYIGFELDWDVNLVLKKNEIPALKLDQPRQLGRTAWLLSRPAERDASDLKLQPAQ
jgi:type VI secretion system protein ImpH